MGRAVKHLQEAISPPRTSKVPYFGRWPLQGVRPRVDVKAEIPLNGEAGGFADGQGVLE